MMNNTDIIAFAKAAEKRAEAATPGPWEESNHTEFWEGGCIRPEYGHAICVFTNGWDQTIRDRNFISASRTDVPTLARMVVKMAETLEAYALDEDKELGKLAYVTLFNLTAELKRADDADDR